jgi:hypothetical protein
VTPARENVFNEMLEIVSLVAAEPCENAAPDPQAAWPPRCGTCWTCHARALVDRIMRSGARRGQTKSPVARGKQPRRRARRS